MNATKKGPGLGDSSLGMNMGGPTRDDFKTTALKKGLLNDAKGALVAEKLQCRPIQGHDLPLSSLSMKQVTSSTQKLGMGGAQLVEVENLDKVQMPELPEPGPPLPESELILRSLLPNQLKAPSMVFIEEEDLNNEEDLVRQSQQLPSNPRLRGPLTAFQ